MAFVEGAVFASQQESTPPRGDEGGQNSSSCEADFGTLVCPKIAATLDFDPDDLIGKTDNRNGIADGWKELRRQKWWDRDSSGRCERQRRAAKPGEADYGEGSTRTPAADARLAIDIGDPDAALAPGEVTAGRGGELLNGDAIFNSRAGFASSSEVVEYAARVYRTQAASRVRPERAVSGSCQRTLRGHRALWRVPATEGESLVTRRTRSFVKLSGEIQTGDPF